MRAQYFLVAAVVLASSTAAVAADNDDLRAIGGLRAIGATVCCISVLAVCVGIPVWVFRGFLGELARGRKQGLTDEEVLDDLPKKRQVMFKGERVPEWKIAARGKATQAILKFLSYTDNWFDKKYVADVAEEGFRLVKEAVEARSVKGIERRVTPDCRRT